MSIKFEHFIQFLVLMCTVQSATLGLVTQFSMAHKRVHYSPQEFNILKDVSNMK